MSLKRSSTEKLDISSDPKCIVCKRDMCPSPGWWPQKLSCHSNVAFDHENLLSISEHLACVWLSFSLFLPPCIPITLEVPTIVIPTLLMRNQGFGRQSLAPGESPARRQGLNTQHSVSSTCCLGSCTALPGVHVGRGGVLTSPWPMCPTD